MSETAVADEPVETYFIVDELVDVLRLVTGELEGRSHSRNKCVILSKEVLAKYEAKYEQNSSRGSGRE